jgi:hypothetical protein
MLITRPKETFRPIDANPTESWTHPSGQKMRRTSLGCAYVGRLIIKQSPTSAALDLYWMETGKHLLRNSLDQTLLKDAKPTLLGDQI